MSVSFRRLLRIHRAYTRYSDRNENRNGADVLDKDNNFRIFAGKG